MTRLIYRGFAHDGANGTREPAAATMIYRGVRHDRIAASRSASRDLRQYRGVAYMKGGAPVEARPAAAATVGLALN